MEGALIILAIAVATVFTSRFFLPRPKQETFPLSDQQEIVFYPARWPYILVACGFILSALPFSFFVFNEKIRHEFLAWFGLSCISLMFFVITVGGIYQMLTAQVRVTSQYVEYRDKWKTCRIPLNEIQFVLVLGIYLYIEHGTPRRFPIPLIFKNSRSLVATLREAVRRQKESGK